MLSAVVMTTAFASLANGQTIRTVTRQETGKQRPGSRRSEHVIGIFKPEREEPWPGNQLF